MLADEINRTPPKTQAALLAMQERRVTVRGRPYVLPEPFFVLATQNPIEQEGTYTLPEAQLDRFMFMVTVGYPTRDEEVEILRRTTGGGGASLTPMFNEREVAALQQVVRRVPVADHVLEYAISCTAPAPAWSRFPMPPSGWPGAWAPCRSAAHPRRQGLALLGGRFHVTTEDIDALAKPVLRHRLVASFAAQAEGLSTDDIIGRLVEAARGRAGAGKR